MIFTDRTITVRKGESRIDEPIVVYRGDYELEVRFTILNSRFKFMSGTNMIESEKASYGQLAILTPYGGNIFSDIVRCNDGSVTFILTADMLNQIEEVGLYSFQIRLMDYNKESRVSIPPIEFGIEVREPIASEDHDNSVNNAIVGYSIAKVVDPKEENVGDTFDDNGNYNKTEWETGDRISEGKLNKIEDAIDKVNRNGKKDIATLDKRINSNFNVLNSRVDNIATLAEGSTTGDAELIDGRVSVDGTIYNSIGEAIREQVSNGANISRKLPLTDDITDEIIDGVYIPNDYSNLHVRLPLETVYTGLVYNVKPGEVFRIRVFSTNLNWGSNICNFYDEYGNVIKSPTDYYKHKIISDVDKIIEVTAPENAVTLSYTDYIADKDARSCRCFSSNFNIPWLEVNENNLSEPLKEKIINPINLSTKGRVIAKLEYRKHDIGCYYASSGKAIENVQFNTGFYDVEPGETIRVRVYSLNFNNPEYNILSFWSMNLEKIVHPEELSYEIYKPALNIVDIVIPEGVYVLSITEALEQGGEWDAYSVGGRIVPDWLKIEEDMMPKSFIDLIDNADNPYNLTTENKISKNIIHTKEMGYYLDTSGIAIPNNTMGTAYFDVIEGSTYRMTIYAIEYVHKRNAVIYFWNANGVLIDTTTYNFEVVESIPCDNGHTRGIIDIVAPEGAVRGTTTISVDNPQDTCYVKQIAGKISPNWLAVSKDNLDGELTDLIYGNGERLKYGHCLAKPFNFDGKTAAFFGDSITYGVMSPNLGLTPNSYGRLFSTAVGLSFENQAVSGACFSPVNSLVKGNDICDKILSYTTAKDFIFIAGGTNDYSMGNEVGTLGDTTTNTVYGALHVICEHLRNNLPNTTVIFITPINQNIPQSRSIAHMNVYRNAIFEVATSYGFNVVDGSQIGFPTEKGSFADLMCQDGVHPNQLGHEMYAKSLRGILL